MSAPATHTHSLSHKIVKNTAYNTIGRFWGILIGIVLTPFIVGHIGIERFGVWAIVGVITGYFGLMDFGIGLSFVKYITEFHTKKEYDNINHLINTGFVLYFALAVISTVIVVIFRGPLLSMLNIPSYLRHEASIVLTIGIALFGVSNAISPFIALQGGLQRMDILNKIGIAASMVSAAGTVIVLIRGYGLIGLMLNNVFIFILTAPINIYIASRLLPELRFRPFGFNRKTFFRLFHFGYNIQISKVSSMIANQTEKIFISCFLSIGMVAFYQLGSSIIYYLSSIPAMLTSAVMPAFSEIEAKGERARLVEAYIRSIKYLSALTAPLFIFVIISAYQIMTVWMGQGYEKTGLVIQILAVAWLVPTIAQVAVYVSFAIDRPQFMAIGSVILVTLNVIVSFILIKIFGFYGAAWGSLIAINIGTFYFVWTLNAHLKVSFKKMGGAIFPYVAAALMASVAVALIDNVITHFQFDPGRLQLLIILMVRFVIFAAVYIITIFLSGLAKDNDIVLVLRRFMPGKL